MEQIILLLLVLAVPSSIFMIAMTGLIINHEFHLRKGKVDSLALMFTKPKEVGK